jgi:hypothetical protein
MGSNELHEQPAEPVRHVDDQSVLVATEVEDQAVIADEIDAPAELAFDLVWAVPVGLAGDGEPDADRSLRSRVALPEFLQRPTGNHLHGLRFNIMSSIWGQEDGRVKGCKGPDVADIIVRVFSTRSQTGSHVRKPPLLQYQAISPPTDRRLDGLRRLV